MAHRWRTLSPKASTTDRGYGNQHMKVRKAAAAEHHPEDPCTRCGHPLGPMGPHLHLDHTDDRTTYLGFSHGSIPCPYCGRRCNLRAGAKAGRARQGRQQTFRW